MLNSFFFLFTENEMFRAAKNLASKLQSLLEPLDVLRCNGIILPERQEEWKETQEILTRCSSTLKNIVNVIGAKGEAYCTMNAGLKSFVETHNEIGNLQKKYVAKIRFSSISKGTWSWVYQCVKRFSICISDWKRRSAICKYSYWKMACFY